MNSLITLNADFIEEQFALWKTDPAKLAPDWRFFFEGFELGFSGRWEAVAPGDGDQGVRQARVNGLVRRYHELGHLLACLDPLEACLIEHPLLSLEAVGLSAGDLDKAFIVPDVRDTAASTGTVGWHTEITFTAGPMWRMNSCT